MTLRKSPSLCSSQAQLIPIWTPTQTTSHTAGAEVPSACDGAKVKGRISRGWPGPFSAIIRRFPKALTGPKPRKQLQRNFLVAVHVNTRAHRNAHAGWHTHTRAHTDECSEGYTSFLIQTALPTATAFHKDSQKNVLQLNVELFL